MGFFGFGKKNKEKEQEKMKTGLEKTRTGFWGNILNTLTGSVIDDDMYDDLEEQLILADVGGEVAVRLVDKLRDRVHEKGLKTGEEAADALRDIIAEEMTPDAEMDLSGKPAVILVIGVNGVGKTTSIAKLADHYTREGKKVMLAAGDTFRAAASEQLEIWADRAGVPIVSAGEGADPAAVIFDTVKSATARGYDMVIADTAGRLHNKANLMAELSKISRSVKKASPEASLETLLVLDAITGQNAISQAKEFCKAADATGIILTKLDGTAKGGCVVAVKQRLGLPVRFIGVGEGIDDLLPFTLRTFRRLPHDRENGSLGGLHHRLIRLGGSPGKGVCHVGGIRCVQPPERFCHAPEEKRKNGARVSPRGAEDHPRHLVGTIGNGTVAVPECPDRAQRHGHIDTGIPVRNREHVHIVDGNLIVIQRIGG